MDTPRFLETAGAALLLAGTFVLSDRVFPLHTRAAVRRNVLSFSAGMSVAYVFVHVMPELSDARTAFVASTSLPLRFEGMAVYVLALVGFLTLYSVERLSRAAGSAGPEKEPAAIFDIKLGSFAAYVGLIAYLLVNNLETSPASLTAYAVAMAVHFLMFDHSFREQGGEAYRRRGRYLLAGAALAGWGIGWAVALPRDVLALMLGFLSGGVIVNAAIAELPDRDQGGVRAFWAGGISYSIVLIPLR